MAEGPEDPLPDRKFGVGYRALVVDDDPDVLDVLYELVSAAGFAVEAAANLADARACVDAGVPDLVVTDKDLPDGSGLELARYLTNQKADCEIVMVTAHGTTESAFEAFELGLAELVEKPFSDLVLVRRAFRRAIERLLRARRVAAEQAAQAAKGDDLVRLPTSESQRRLRFFVELRARFILVDGSLTGPAFVSQLSTTDLFVETDRPLPIGTSVRLRLYIPGVDAVDLRAVVRRHGEGASMLGMRLAFTDPSDEAQARISAHLEPGRRQFAESGVSSSAPVLVVPDRADLELENVPALKPEPELGGRFTPDALRFFLGMQGARVLDFLDTLDTETVQAILDLDSPRIEPSPEPEPAHSPAPFDTVMPALFDPENAEVEDLPTAAGVQPREPSEPVDEEERLRRKYGLSESTLESEQIRKKYGIDESLFGDDEGVDTAPAPPARPRKASDAPRASAEVLANLGKTPEQRHAFAEELKRRGAEAMSRGLVLKAAADLGLALAFAPEDKELRELHDRVKGQANSARADDLYRQGLQQNALGDGAAAAKLLVGACELVNDPKYALAAARVLLQSGDADSARKSRSILRNALGKDPDNADLHVLYGKTAEIEGYPKAAQRSYLKALELAPAHAVATELLAQLKEA